LNFRVWVTDADVSLMNNAKYLTVMEMGRIDLMSRAGFLKLSRQQRWAAPLASISVQFKKPLKRFQRFQLRTSLIYWDEKHIYLKHVMEKGGQIVAVGIARVVILGQQGRVKPAEALNALGHSIASPSIPPVIDSLKRSERLMRGL
jgi:acyl-CoA thioesterase FadM